jgi:excisionase family DNA binding protein
MSDTVVCDCSTAHPGILWPWGASVVPYVERCDTCQRYASDDEAADALVAGLLEVGLDPLRGDHVARDGVDGPRRVGVFVWASPTAIGGLDDSALDRLAGRIADRLGTTNLSPWLTAPEAAGYLRCSLSRLRKLSMLGDLPTQRDGGRALYRRADLDAFVARGGASTGR